jgi:hypothetical protein
MVFYDPFAGNKVDVPHPDATSITGFFYGVIESSAQDGENVHVFFPALGISMSEGFRGCREHGKVGIIAHHLGESHQTARPGSTDHIIVIPQLRGLEPVNVCVLGGANIKKARILQTHGHKKTRLRRNRDTKIAQIRTSSNFI